MADVYDERIGQGLADEEWLHDAGDRGWVVLMEDAKIRYRPAELGVITDMACALSALPTRTCAVRRRPRGWSVAASLKCRPTRADRGLGWSAGAVGRARRAAVSTSERGLLAELAEALCEHGSRRGGGAWPDALPSVRVGRRLSVNRQRPRRHGWVWPAIQRVLAAPTHRCCRSPSARRGDDLDRHGRGVPSGPALNQPPALAERGIDLCDEHGLRRWLGLSATVGSARVLTGMRLDSAMFGPQSSASSAATTKIPEERLGE